MTGKTLIDRHIHLAALPDCDNGYYLSPKMLCNLRFHCLPRKHLLYG